MTARRQFLLIGTASVIVAVFVVTVPTFRHFFDLGVYRGAVHSWLLDGGDLYAYRYQGTEYGFTYPPFAALVLSPLAATAWPIAVAAGLVVNTAMVALLLRWYVVPVLERRGWPAWSAYAVGLLVFALFEPSRDTFSFGQVNLVLLVLVCALPNSRWAGVGMGLAAAIKLTPAVFIGYLLITRQFRAAITAIATAATATLLTVVVAPAESRTFWTSALWDTNRVGQLAYVSNQSLRGVVARLDAPTTVWLIAVAVVLVFWFWSLRTVDHRTGFAQTGLVACLISPVTWVHHLVWLLPALFLLLERGRLTLLAVLGVILSSSVVWLWWNHPHGWLAFVGSNAYVWVTLVLAVQLRSIAARAPNPHPMTPAPEPSGRRTQ